MDKQDLILTYGPLTVPISGAVLAMVFAKIAAGAKAAFKSTAEWFKEKVEDEIKGLKKAMQDQGELITAANFNNRELLIELRHVWERIDGMSSDLKETRGDLSRDADLIRKFVALEHKVEALDPRKLHAMEAEQAAIKAEQLVLQKNQEVIINGLKKLKKSGTDGE